MSIMTTSSTKVSEIGKTFTRRFLNDFDLGKIIGEVVFSFKLSRDVMLW
jgi:hypothetical protein